MADNSFYLCLDKKTILFRRGFPRLPHQGRPFRHLANPHHPRPGVWLVSADETRRSGAVYSRFKNPELLLGWMESIAVFDGHIKDPTDRQVRASVLWQLRDSLSDSILVIIPPKPRMEQGERRFKLSTTESVEDTKPSPTLEEICNTVSDGALCPVGDAWAMLERLRAPSVDRRAELRVALAGLLSLPHMLGIDEPEWLSQFQVAHDEDRLGSEKRHLALVAVMRNWLAWQCQGGKVPESEELRAELDRLGVLVPASSAGSSG